MQSPMKEQMSLPRSVLVFSLKTSRTLNFISVDQNAEVLSTRKH
jgi:hypothetical protein